MAAEEENKFKGENPLRKKFYFKTIFFFIIFLLLVFRVEFTASQTGFKKYIENYRPKDSNQLWSNRVILQDKRGIIYAGNLDYVTNKGKLLQYDGVSWRTIKGYESGVYSMAVDDRGDIYIGGNNEIGFLIASSNGSLQYKSLIGQLTEDKKDFGYVWSTQSAKEGIYFISSDFLFRWDPDSGKIKVWKSKQKEKQ